MTATLDMSLEHQVALMEDEEREAVLADLDMDSLVYDWSWNGRPSQLIEPDSDFAVMLALAGRGWGKTLVGAQWIRAMDAHWRRLGRDSAHLRVAMVGRTSADVRDVMLEGPSGLMNIYPPSLQSRVIWTPSRRRVELPNGGVITCFSADEPAQLRGPQFHCFPAGTMIRTADGPRPIESVRVGDLVWTRQGLRPVEAASSSEDVVISLRHAGGILTGTPEHPVLTQRGWVDLSLVRPTDTLVGWANGSGRSTTEAGHGARSDLVVEKSSGVPMSLGRRSTVQYRRGTRSITSTSTASTTTPRIWLPSHPRTTKRFIEQPSSLAPVSNAERTSTSSLSAATGSIATHARRNGDAKLSGRLTPTARADTLSAAATAAASLSPVVEPIAVKGVSTSGRVTQVFNLSVAEVPEFFADDVLVHNCGWADELATYKQVRSEDDATAWENLRIAVRLGKRPQVLATTTPKRVPVVRQLLAEAAEHPSKVMLRRGKTKDNRYLSDAYLDVLMSMYEGTPLGRQELEGEMLDDVAGAMTTEAIINRFRVRSLPQGIPWIKLVSIDPSVAERPHDECGIMVIYISRTWPVLKRHAFIVDDLSLRASPNVWAKVAAEAAYLHDAQIIAETNQGAHLVSIMLRQAAQDLKLPVPNVLDVWATKSKAVRAEPVGGAYAQGRVHHVNVFADLESQETSWVYGESGYSPDRQDAAVQGIASGLFPEALTTGGLSSTVIQTVANTHIPLTRQLAMARRGGYG
jgi:phage terminase large subunit-like protein